MQPAIKVLEDSNKVHAWGQIPRRFKLCSILMLIRKMGQLRDRSSDERNVLRWMMKCMR